MATITFPTEFNDDVTLDVSEIVDLQPAGVFTLVIIALGNSYRSPAPIEMFKLTLASGGGVVPFQNTAPLTRVSGDDS